MVCRIRSLPVTHLLSLPRKTNLMVGGTFIQMSPVAMAAATSVEPMPVEKAPIAPYVHVCESAPMITSPGSTRPFSGRITCSIPIWPTSK